MARTTPAFSLLVTLLLAATITAFGCGSDETSTTEGATATTPETTPATAPATTATSPVAPTTPATPTLATASSTTTTEKAGPSPAQQGVSAAALAYAESLGGTSHQGEMLHLVIGTSAGSEAEAQRALDKAIPYFGDMQSYFIVQRSDSFEGLEPGWWVVIEAYYDEPQTSEMDFGRRGFPDAYVKQVTVLTSDPVPVYEDAVGLTQVELFRDVITRSGAVGTDFEAYDYLISEDGKWAGIMIGGPELQLTPVLMFLSGLKGWQVVDHGIDMTYQGILDQGAPEEIASFLTCFT